MKVFGDTVTEESRPLLQAIATDRSSRRRKTARGLLVGQVLNNCRTFSQDTSVVEPQRRNIPFRVHRQIILSTFCLVLGEIYLFQFDWDSGFARNNMRRERARAARVIELHRVLLWVLFECVTWAVTIVQRAGASSRLHRAPPSARPLDHSGIARC